jgi:hypothetical protein
MEGSDAKWSISWSRTTTHRSEVVLSTGPHTKTYAHFPSTLISTNPAIKLNIAALVLPHLACNKPPDIQSLANISTMPTQAKIPALSASNVPIATMVDGSLPLKKSRTPMPMAMPIGVTRAKLAAMSSLVGSVAALAERPAMHVPRAMPSNV